MFWLGRLIFSVSINSDPDNIYISARTKSHLRRSEEELPKVTSPEDTWPELEVTWPEVIACACPDFPPYFFKPQRLKYQLVVFLVHDVIKHFIFPYFFKPQRLKYQLVVFLVHDVIKHFIFPYFFKPQRLKYQLVVFLVHDVIKHFIFPYFFPVLFQTTTFEISVSCFSSAWRYKTFHFPVLFPVLFQTATFEIQPYLLF